MTSVRPCPRCKSRHLHKVAAKHYRQCDMVGYVCDCGHYEIETRRQGCSPEIVGGTACTLNSAFFIDRQIFKRLRAMGMLKSS